MNAKHEIHALLQIFQNGYTHRDLSQLDAFMDLFTPDCEIIGTNGIKPGLDEWYTSREAASALIKGDWETWGDLRLDVESASIHTLGEVGWIAASATVSQIIGAENYASFLGFIKAFIEESTLSPEQKLHYILRGGMNTVYELRRGEECVWPLRFTAVVVQNDGNWKFAQINFSFPTTHFPDVRILDGEERGEP
jgi:hypothetical protein